MPHCHFRACILTEAEEEAIIMEAKELSRIMDLNIVRLKFTAYLQDSTGAYTRALKPVISNPIYDSSEFSSFLFYYHLMTRNCTLTNRILDFLFSGSGEKEKVITLDFLLYCIVPTIQLLMVALS